jgi:hypothetical protein
MWCAVAAGVLLPSFAWAQVTAAAGYTPPDDTPSIKVGAVIFADYTYNSDPTTKDQDGNTIHADGFQVTRSYINVTGNISHFVAFRITPDITRENFAGLTPAPGLAGSYVFRLKYAFAQFNMDDWMTKGSWVRFGLQQTPFVDYTEGIYRYRFQGTTFAEREGFLTSSDNGVSFHYNIAKNYGDVHVGYYNGDGYSKPEANDQQAFQIRGTLRPFATSTPVLRGFRITGFYDGDNYVKNDEKTRAIFEATFEHKYLNAGYDYLNATDQTLKVNPKIKSSGYSFWFTPKSTIGLEGLFRYDHYTPTTSTTGAPPAVGTPAFDQRYRYRTIVGVAYWFKHQGAVSSALMLDYDGFNQDHLVPAQPKQNKIALHALINF